LPFEFNDFNTNDIWQIENLYQSGSLKMIKSDSVARKIKKIEKVYKRYQEKANKKFGDVYSM